MSNVTTHIGLKGIRESILIANEVLVNDIKSNIPKADKAFSEALVKEAQPYIPHRSGKLANSLAVKYPSTYTFTAEYAPYVLNPKTKLGNPKKYFRDMEHDKTCATPIKSAYENNREKLLDIYKGVLLGDE